MDENSLLLSKILSIASFILAILLFSLFLFSSALIGGGGGALAICFWVFVFIIIFIVMGVINSNRTERIQRTLDEQKKCGE